jgi:carbohydrate kinase (thermoresistant glucokinase family)
MGVCGSGKSTLGATLARELGATFLEGDEFHPPDNVARMAAGVALTDADRQGWLQRLGARLGDAQCAGQAVALSCSALKRSYRDTLRAQAPNLALVYLAGTPELLAQRMAGRTGHYMPPSLLASQLATLEPPSDDEHALTLDIARPPHELLQDALAWLSRSHAR